MRNDSYSAVNVVALGLHVFGVVAALAILTISIGEVLSAQEVLKSIPIAKGLVVEILVFGVLAAGASVLVCSALALVVTHTARAAQASEDLADLVRRLELEKTRDSGVYYRVR